MKNQKKPFYKRWWFIVLVIILVIGGVENVLGITPKDNTTTSKVTSSSSSGSVKAVKAPTSSGERKQTPSNLDSKKIQSQIDKDLKLDQGFAKGTLDRDGNPTQSGTPNSDFAYSLNVESIKFKSFTDIDINVSSEFASASDNEKDAMANSVSGLIVSSIEAASNPNQDDIKNGPFLAFYAAGNSIGHSKITDHKQFTWQ